VHAAHIRFVGIASQIRNKMRGGCQRQPRLKSFKEETVDLLTSFFPERFSAIDAVGVPPPPNWTRVI
jgi:hypothetical protein